MIRNGSARISHRVCCPMLDFHQGGSETIIGLNYQAAQAISGVHRNGRHDSLRQLRST